MNSGRTVFAQLIENLPHKEFHKCVARFAAITTPRTSPAEISIWRWPSPNSLIARSLRDIETCLGAVSGQLYHMGFRGSVARSTRSTKSRVTLCSFASL
jgi:hypothetical protein